jgi:hypothetical protein
MMTQHRAVWLAEAGWGVFLHYLAQPASSNPGDDVYDSTVSVAAWNEQVDSFDVGGLADDLESIRAPYAFLTIGQNSGFYCSPNSTYDELVGRAPSRLSRRDIIGELSNELSSRGIRLLVYLPAHAAADDRTAVEALECTPDWDASKWQLRPGRYLRTADTDRKLSGFQRNWERIITEWSMRWGERVHGWWIDGCYFADTMYRDEEEPGFGSFARAMRAGNPGSIVSFNPGVRLPIRPHTPYEDFTAGEISGAFPITPAPWETGFSGKGLIEGVQFHLLSYAGSYWGRGAPRMSKELLHAYTSHVRALSGAISWDVPVSKQGRISGEYLDILRGL